MKETGSVVKYRLKKILGLGFGIAVMVGTIIGSAILRTPGSVASILQNQWLIILGWICGGIYVLLAIGSLAELAAMIPKAGGGFNYVKRAFGNYPGFVIGWFTYTLNAVAAAYIAIAFSEYLILFFAPLKGAETIIAAGLIAVFTVFQMTGVKSGSRMQQVTSFIKVLAYLVLIICCFLFGGNNAPAAELNSSLNNTVIYGGFILAFIPALQLILGTYDGFDAPVYFAEEDTDPGKNIPRTLFRGAIVVMLIYVLLNMALLYVLPMSSFAGSKLAVADAAEVIFGRAGFTIVTTIALLSLLGILNSQLMICSRILYGLSREGFFLKKGTLVNKGGTPYLVLIITALIVFGLLFVGSFEQLFALGAFIGIGAGCMVYSSVFKLRKSEPDLPRPYRAWDTRIQRC